MEPSRSVPPRGPESEATLDPRVVERIPPLAPEVLAGLAEFPVALIVDTMGPVAGPQQMMSPQMVRRTTRKRISGQAVTAAVGLADNLMLHAALRELGAGHVLVVAANGMYGAQWGDTVTRVALMRNVRGAVVDGAVRDIDTVDGLGFPVWSTMVSPLHSTKSAPGWVNLPVTCAGVHVAPGDVVIADGDGVVCIPHRLAEIVLERAREQERMEATVRDAVAAGKLPGEARGLYEQLDALIPQSKAEPA